MDGGPHVVELGIAVILRGNEVSLGPSEIDQLELYNLEEVERPSSYPDMRNKIGKFPVLTDRGYHHVWFESELEADHYQELVWDGVDELNTQCFELRAVLDDGSVRTRRPDALVRRAGATIVIDITSEAFLHDEKADSFDFTADICAAVGWSYMVGTDRTLRPQRRANLNFLTMVEDLDVEPVGGPQPRTVGDLAEAYGGGADGHQLAYAALWRRHYWINMDKPLEDTSRLSSRAPGPVLFAWGEQ